MKNFGKIISVILASILVLSSSAFAVQNTDYADELYDLGLFKGTELGYELDKTFTREEAATMLVRLLGEEENAARGNYAEYFSDVEKDRWSFTYVMYCYENDITKGTSADTFSPEKEISAEEFAALLLRLMGYTDTEPETALEECIYLNLVNSEIVRELKDDKAFLRDDMVYMVYRSLMTETAGGIILAQVLQEKSVISAKEAAAFDVYKTSESIDDLIDRLLN